jgi:hypothetical protein
VGAGLARSRSSGHLPGYYALFAKRTRPDSLDSFVGLYLPADVVPEHIAGDMHERIAKIRVDAHTGQAGVVMVEQAGFFFGLVGRDAHQPFGRKAGAATNGVPGHPGRGDGAGVRVHR